jgi:hypothetical protein
MSNKLKQLQKACCIVLESRMYRNIYIKKADRDVFSQTYSFELGDGNMATAKAHMKSFGRSKTKSKAYLVWEDHKEVEKIGKPVKTVEIKSLLEVCNNNQNNNVYEL